MDSKLSIVSGRPRYADIEILSKLEVSKYEKLKVDSIPKGIDILEPGIEYVDITFSQVCLNLADALTNPKNTANDCSKDLKVLLQKKTNN
jgi:hypothetical protein